MLETECTLNGSGDDAAFPIEKEKGDHADERRQGCGESRDRAQRPSAAKVEAAEEKRERQPDNERGDDGSDRDDERAPERFTIRWTRGEGTPVVEAVGKASRDHRNVRQNDAPDEEREYDRRGEDEPAPHRKSSATGLGRSFTPTSPRSAKLPSSLMISNV